MDNKEIEKIRLRI